MITLFYLKRRNNLYLLLGIILMIIYVPFNDKKQEKNLFLKYNEFEIPLQNSSLLFK